jgi:hypothetical protein
LLLWGGGPLTNLTALPLKLNCVVFYAIMTEFDTESVLRYRNRAARIRVTATSVGPRARVILLNLAAEFDSLAEDIERAGKSR